VSAPGLVLGVDTSCDDTAAAVVEDGLRVRSNVIASQADLHARYGGVVPEIACRAHVEALLPVIEEALRRAGVGFPDLAGIAVTRGPGLVGALLLGMTATKVLAWVHDLPLVAVNHIDGHIFAARLSDPELDYPYVALVASGGHTSLHLAESPTRSRLLGTTIDDAAGEAFDKVATVLGLSYPGGPAIERTAAAGAGDPGSVRFPRTSLAPGSLDFSFSGLKTAVLYHMKGHGARRRGGTVRPDVRIPDVAAAFQEAVVDVLVRNALRACEETVVHRLAIGGGVACNQRLRTRMAEAAGRKGVRVSFAPKDLCLDNGAMIAGLGFHLLREGRVEGLEFDAEPRQDLRRAGVGA
jgi:N6-L-threonylcarbamoyladenine synthase